MTMNFPCVEFFYKSCFFSNEVSQFFLCPRILPSRRMLLMMQINGILLNCCASLNCTIRQQLFFFHQLRCILLSWTRWTCCSVDMNTCSSDPNKTPQPIVSLLLHTRPQYVLVNAQFLFALFFFFALLFFFDLFHHTFHVFHIWCMWCMRCKQN